MSRRASKSPTSKLEQSNRPRSSIDTVTTSHTGRSRSEPPAEWERVIDREFEALDIDADGYVSVKDMQTVLKNFSHLYNSEAIIVRIFEELDLNRDRRISRQEFEAYKSTLIDRQNRFRRSTFEEKLEAIFKLFDRNQDNYISPQEVRETMQNLGEHLDDDLLEEMMQTADTNQDGRISRDEFKRLLLELHAPK